MPTTSTAMVRNSCLRTVALVLLFCTSVVYAQSTLFGEGPTPLPVEEAFKPSVDLVDAKTLEVSFEIAEGYYLYRDKLGFIVNDEYTSTGQATLGKAKAYEDEFFGTTYIYREQATATVPLDRQQKDAHSITLDIKYQGCADMGICYPPSVASVAVNLPVLADAGTAVSDAGASPLPAPKKPKKSLTDLLGNSMAGGEDDNPVLSPQEAFTPSIIAASNNAITVEWFAEPGHYLYRDKMYFTLLDAEPATISSSDIDNGLLQHDEFFGDVEVLREVSRARLAINPAAQVSNAKLQIQYQGCADIGICYPPQTVELPLQFVSTSIASTNDAQGGSRVTGQLANNAAGSTPNAIANATNTAASSVAVTDVPVSEQDKLAALLGTGDLWVIAGVFYVAGLLLAFTACVYPMIPILSSLIVGHGSSITSTKAFGLSAVYVLSMASVYTVVGILVGLSGYNIQPLFQNPWVLTAFAALFVLLALSMFGLYQLQMPSWIQAKLAHASNQQKGGSWTGVAIMGMLSALIVGPCVTPPLVAALAYIANTGDAVLGGIALFLLGLGMGTPLLFIGTSAGKWMPKAGGWMQTIQRIFGIILIGVAIYMLSRFLPANITMLLAAALAVFTGVFFGATDSTDASTTGAQRLGKSAGILAAVYGIVLMIGALSGSTSFIRPLSGFKSAGTSGEQASDHVQFRRVKGIDGLNVVLNEARAASRPVMFDFYADWCISCKEMEAYTFTDARVKSLLGNAILIQADVTKNDAQDQALLKKFGLFGPPAILLYDNQGNEIPAARVVGFMPADKFARHLESFLGGTGA